jgi:hypothetical protein
VTLWIPGWAGPKSGSNRPWLLGKARLRRGEVRGTERLNRPHGFLGLLGRASGAPDDAADFPVVQIFREHGSGRTTKSEETVQVLGSIPEEITKGGEDGCGFFEWPERRTELNEIHPTKTEFERSHDAEVSPATAYSPKQVRIFLIVRGQKAAVRQDYVNL